MPTYPLQRRAMPLLAALLALGAAPAHARPPVSVSDVAFAEEIQIACSRIKPQQAEAFEKKKRALLAAVPALVEEARSAPQYETFRGFARTVLGQLGDELPQACDKFLVQDDPGAVPDHGKPEAPKPAS